MKEERLIKKQLLKNMLITLVTFTIIFSILGLTLFSQVKSSMYQYADKELENYKNRSEIVKNKNINIDINVPGEVDNDKQDENIKLPQLHQQVDEDEENPRLVTIYRKEDGTIIEDISYKEYFENIKFDTTNLEQIYDIVINGSYKYRGINYQVNRNGELVYVQVLINVDSEQAMLENITTTIIIGFAICIILSIVASYLLSKNAIKPIVTSWKKQTEFVQNASHELRTPLTIIQAKQELLLENPRSRIIDNAEEITTSLNETKRLSKLIKNLMALARSDQNKIKLNKEIFEIDEFIKNIVQPYKELAEQENKPILLNLNYGKSVQLDKEKMHEMLVILLDNSIKYTKENDSITISTYEKDGKCVIEVADTGIGVSDEGLTRIFERFYREDKAHSRQTGGTGLGLSIAQDIVEMHRGTIKAMHNEPKGTIIQVKL